MQAQVTFQRRNRGQFVRNAEGENQSAAIEHVTVASSTENFSSEPVALVASASMNVAVEYAATFDRAVVSMTAGSLPSRLSKPCDAWRTRVDDADRSPCPPNILRALSVIPIAYYCVVNADDRCR